MSTHKYAPVSGILYVNGNPVKTLAKNGYVVTSYQGKKCYAHRLAWKLMTGEFTPTSMDIDHINRDRKDNSWSNLRLATRSDNLKNCKKRRNSLTGKEDRALDLYSQGYSFTQIGEMLNTDRHFISRLIKEV